MNSNRPPAASILRDISINDMADVMLYDVYQMVLYFSHYDLEGHGHWLWKMYHNGIVSKSKKIKKLRILYVAKCK
jgi:hypothetical protein